MGSGNEKIPHIPWKGTIPPQEVEKRNHEARQGLNSASSTRSEHDALLAGIDEQTISITRKKCFEIISDTEEADLNASGTRADAIIKLVHTDPVRFKEMFITLHGVNEFERQTDPIGFAAAASAFLFLTEKPTE